MAITVNLYYTGKDGAAKAFANEMVSSGTVSAIRAEEGNLRYEYFSPLDDPETILLIDSWSLWFSTSAAILPPLTTVHNDVFNHSKKSNYCKYTGKT